jgi:hypothetical protein
MGFAWDAATAFGGLVCSRREASYDISVPDAGVGAHCGGKRGIAMILSAGGIHSFGDVGNRIGINSVRDIEEHFRLVQSAREFCYRSEVIVRSDGFDTGILHDLIGSRELAHFAQQSVVLVEGHRDQQAHSVRLVQPVSERNNTV